MLEVPVGGEVKTNQDGYDLGILHHPFSASLGCALRGEKRIICHLFFKFLPEIIRNTEKF